MKTRARFVALFTVVVLSACGGTATPPGDPPPPSAPDLGPAPSQPAGSCAQLCDQLASACGIGKDACNLQCANLTDAQRTCMSAARCDPTAQAACLDSGSTTGTGGGCAKIGESCSATGAGGCCGNSGNPNNYLIDCVNTSGGQFVCAYKQ